MNHFCEINQLDADQITLIINRAIAWKNIGRSSHAQLCQGRTLAMMFDKASTRTRISFSVAAQHLGMSLIDLDSQSMHFSSGKETLADTARMLNGFVDAVLWRTDDPEKLLELKQNLTIPLINGLTDSSHPCQIMADLMTVKEHFGDFNGRKVLWCGDYNNVARSWCHAAHQLDFQLRLASPIEYAINTTELEEARLAGADITCYNDPHQAALGVDVVITDVWVSMGDQDAEARTALLKPYQVNSNLMAQANDQAIFMHCLPAVRGQEVTSEVLEGLQSVAWQEAENRLHVQKAILAWCLGRLPQA